MSRTTIPLQASDISQMARALRSQLLARDGVPGHLELLNILARSVGRRNFQHLRAEAQGTAPPAPDTEPGAAAPPVVDPRKIERARRCFGPDGRLQRWPARRGDQVLALWGLWSKLPARRDLSEQEISQHLRALHDFGDHALLRRELCDGRLFARSSDCRVYRRIEQTPPPEATVLIRQLKVDPPAA